MTIIFRLRDTDKTRTFDSEMSTKVEKKQPNTPCTQALKQAQSFFNVSVSLSKFWFIDLLRIFDSRTSTNFWKKSFFLVFACLGACEKGTFGCLCLKFVNISESKVFIISRSRNQKMLTDILKRTFFSVCLLGRLWTRILWLSFLNFCWYLWIKFSQYINISEIKDCHRSFEKSFCSFLLAWAVVNKASLAVFAQLFSLSLNQMFSTYRCLEIRRCSQICWNLAKATLQKDFQTWHLMIYHAGS